MRHLLMHVTLATAIIPVQAQSPLVAVVPPAAVAPPQSPPAAYSGGTYQQPYPFLPRPRRTLTGPA
jgi:hypothetical protein